VPYMGGDGGNWIDVRPRRRKELRQDDRGQDRQREASRFDVRGDYGYRRSRFRYATREGRFSRNRSWDSSSWERPFTPRSRNPNMEVDVAVHRREGRVISRKRRPSQAWERRAVVAVPRMRSREPPAVRKEGEADSSPKRFVTFYFTNFPMQAPNFILRQGFEVCGMLEEVFIPNKLNVNGEAYGFVRFSNVRDVDKLLRAVNDVHFGHLRVKASLAQFHKTNRMAAVVERAGKEATADQNVEHVEHAAVNGNESVERGTPAVRLDSRVEKEAVVLKESYGPVLEEVTVCDKGKGMVRNNVTVAEEGTGGTAATANAGGMLRQQQPHVTHTAYQHPKKLVRMYRTLDSDLQWARNGLVGTVSNGEAIPVIQRRVEDAGFRDVDIIPLGPDKVFIHSLSNVNILQVVVEAKQFFDLLFSNIVRWEKSTTDFQRGAWIRVYGLPVHAWRESCFKLCVFDCGRYLRTDECTLNRERFDYARVLVATSLLDIVNVTDTIVIDGVQV
jgi:hypothetical protein